MSYLKAALDLAERGFHVFPLISGRKTPISDAKGFPEIATRDPEQIRKWWLTDKGGERPYNIGISTSRYGDNEALVAVDVDNKPATDTKPEKRGNDTLAMLEMLDKELPCTLTQLTPTGGRHMIYRHPVAVKQGVDVLGHALDIRSKGGYLVGAGSRIGGKDYTISHDCEIAPAPQWVIDECGKVTEKSNEIIDLSNINQEHAVERAIYYLKNEAPESIKGDGGDATAYLVAARVKDFGVGQDTALDIMMDHWFEGSGWSPEKLQAKIAHAYKYGTETPGAAAPEADFEAVPEVAAEVIPKEKSFLELMNDKYGFIIIGGNHFVLYEHIDEKGRCITSLLTEATFKGKYAPNSIEGGGTNATTWLKWKKRRTFNGLVFAPGREARNGYYNLWRGYSCDPLPYAAATPDQCEGLDMLLAHTKENICKGDDSLFQWVIGYFAHMVQFPSERPLTTLVFRGRKGVGKNALIDRIGNLLGPTHFITAHDPRYLVSNFNGHMDSCLMLCLDEAFWGGDKTSEGKLKGISTSPTIMIEKKGKEPYQVDNLLRLVILGNEDWIVPASTDERRYAVFNVGEARMQDGKYFARMKNLIEKEGGNQVLLHYLLNYDLSEIDVNKAPKTDGLRDQKLQSMDPISQYWYGCLNEGTITHTDFADGWPRSVSKAQVRDGFYRFHKERNIKSRVPEAVSFGMKLRKMVPKSASLIKRDGEKTFRAFKLGTLSECRKAFEEHIGHNIIWEYEEDDIYE